MDVESINLDIVIDTKEYSVDMKSGLETLSGVSDAIRIIAETILKHRVPQKLHHKTSIRTTLKKSFKGSYGHEFSIDISDEHSKKKLKKLGKLVFSELIAYFISESLYLEADQLSEKAENEINDLGEKADTLIDQLRVSSLQNIHSVSSKFNHDIKIRYHKSRDNIITLANFNTETGLVLSAKLHKQVISISAAISRLNVGTGNGRLLIRGEEETTAFGFSSSYKEIAYALKKKFSACLHSNNGIDRESWIYLSLNVQSIKRQDGKVLKFIIIGIDDEI